MNNENKVEGFSKENLSSIGYELQQLEKLAHGFGNTLTNALSNSIIKGRSLGDTFKTISISLSNMALKAALKPLNNMVSGAIGSMVNSIIPFSDGGVINTPNTILNKPTYFPLSGGKTGLMGESGKEAILPLTRDSSGKLGVRTSSQGQNINVTFNISTPDVEGFLATESEISTKIAQLLQRSNRSI